MDNPTTPTHEVTESTQRMSRIKMSATGRMTSSRSHIVTIRDLSEAGVYISCKSPLREGTELTVTFDIPISDGLERICARGVVRHATRRDRHHGRGMGIRFLRLQFSHMQIIREYLKLRGVDTEALKAKLRR